MVIFRESNVDINFITGFFADKLIFETRNKGIGPQFQRIIIAFASLEFNSVNRTREIDHNGVALGCGAIFFNLNGFAAALSDIVQSFLNFLGRNFSHQFFQFNRRQIADFDFRHQFNRQCEFNIFAVFKFGNFDIRHHNRI